MLFIAGLMTGALLLGLIELLIAVCMVELARRAPDAAFDLGVDTRTERLASGATRPNGGT